MPDPPALQEAFGPSTEPRPGCGVPMAPLLGLFPAGPGGLLTLVVAPLLTHALAHGQAGHPRVHAGDVLGAARGRCSSAPLARLVQAGVPTVRRVGARQSVACTPGRPFVRPRGRRPPAVTGLPRARGLKALGGHDPRVAWVKPTTCPSWLTRETGAALPDARVRREGRYRLGPSGFRTRAITRVTTRLDAETSGGSALAALDRQRGQVETALGHLKTTMPRDGLHGQTVPGGLKAWTVFALVDTLGRLVMGHSATLQHLSAERISLMDARRWLGASGTGGP